MVPIHALITALIRLIGLNFGIRALDKAAEPFLMLFMQRVTMGGSDEFQVPNPWLLFLPMVAFYVLLAVAIFFAAPRLATLMVGGKVPRSTEVGWNATLLFCTGILIIAFAFTRLTDALTPLIQTSLRTHESIAFDNATLFYLFMTVALFCGGIIVIGRFHKISAWMENRRKNEEREQDAGGLES